MNILKGYFDGFEFTRYCVINSVQPSITAPQTNSFHVNNLVSGGRFYYSKLGQIVLDIDITIVKNVMYNLERLNMLLYST
ncbi:distal tail protein Dit, partial [Globicatella sanguinis]|uniref:distal tail protein Dit n=1 Tax=Globicatella sanguinis TaxID=13076 RepID=UPI0012EEAF1A